jgi:hypothetical protein
MSINVVKDEAAGPTAPHSDLPSGAGLLKDAQLLWHELRVLTHDHLQLAALEMQRAGKSLIDMIVAAVVIAVLLLGSWLGLMAAAILWLIEHGIVASSAILIGVGFNVLVAVILYGFIRYKSRYLKFPATVRSLHPEFSGPRNKEEL